VKDKNKPKEQLISELAELRQRIAELEASETERKRVEEALRESESTYRAIFETTGAVIMVVAEDMTISLVNREFEKITGFSKEEVEGKKSWIELVYKEDKEDLERIKEYHRLRRIDPNVAVKTYEARFINKQGNYKDTLVTVDMIPGTKRCVASLIDITERKRVEEALWESEKRYRLLAENAADVIWTVDMNMHPTYISPSIARLLGYSVEEAMAMAMEEVFTPASFEVTMKALAEELAIEKMEQKDIFRSRVMEFELKRKDGSIVPVEISYSFFRGADLQPIAVLAIARDITERKQAEEQRNKFFDLSLHLLLIAGLDGYIKRINPGWTEVLGHTVEELIGTSFFELVHPDDRAATLAEMDKLSTGIITLYFENRYRCKDGSYRLLAWAAVPHPETELVYAIAQDITERRQAEAAMQESERKYRELADFLPQIVFETDERGNLTFSNRYGFQSFGYTLEDSDKGLNALQMLIPEERDRASENIQRVLNGKEFSKGALL